MALSLLRALNTMMVTIINTDMATCTFLRVLVRWASSFFLSAWRMSTVNEVVMAVRAEPAAEYDAAMRPRINRMPIIIGKPSLQAIAPKRASGFSVWMPLRPAYM